MKKFLQFLMILIAFGSLGGCQSTEEKVQKSVAGKWLFLGTPNDNVYIGKGVGGFIFKEDGSVITFGKSQTKNFKCKVDPATEALYVNFLPTSTNENFYGWAKFVLAEGRLELYQPIHDRWIDRKELKAERYKLVGVLERTK